MQLIKPSVAPAAAGMDRATADYMIGRVLEHGTPMDLIDSNGWFAELARQAGLPVADIGVADVPHGLGGVPRWWQAWLAFDEHGTQSATLAPGEILVAHHTSPDWVPLMRRAAAVVTDAGGMTSHAAIVSREYGLPAVVGTGFGTKLIKTGQRIRVDGPGTHIVKEGTPTPQKL